MQALIDNYSEYRKFKKLLRNNYLPEPATVAYLSLIADGVVRPIKIAEALSMIRQCVNQAQSRLLEMGLINVERCDKDGRSIKLSLTEKGEAMMLNVEAVMNDGI